MARYQVLVQSFINNSLHAEGAEIEYDGIPSENLEALDSGPKIEKLKRISKALDDTAGQRLKEAANTEKQPAVPDGQA